MTEIEFAKEIVSQMSSDDKDKFDRDLWKDGVGIMALQDDWDTDKILDYVEQEIQDLEMGVEKVG